MDRRVLALLLLAAGSAGGCGTEQDNRPLELEYLTEAVFAPSCGATQCHSSFRQADGFVFDTPEAVRRSLLITDTGGTTLLRFDYEHPDPAFSYSSRLIQLISETVPFPESPELPRMPLDAPMPNKDIELLRTWIKNPDRKEPPHDVGGRALGAQCNPDAPGGYACDQNDVVVCGDDWNFGQLVVHCDNGCVAQCPWDYCPDPTCTDPDPVNCLVICEPRTCNPMNMCRP